jgi:hypothetical protein
LSQWHWAIYNNVTNGYYNPNLISTYYWVSLVGGSGKYVVHTVDFFLGILKSINKCVVHTVNLSIAKESQPKKKKK